MEPNWPLFVLHDMTSLGVSVVMPEQASVAWLRVELTQVSALEYSQSAFGRAQHFPHWLDRGFGHFR